MKLAIFKDGFWLFLTASVGIHASFLFFLPNPLEQTQAPTEIEVVGTVPVVTLPKKNASATPKLSQIPKQDIQSSPKNESPKSESSKSTLSTDVDVTEQPKPEKVVKEQIRADSKPTPNPSKKSEPKPSEKSEPTTNETTDKTDPLALQKESPTDNPTNGSDAQEPQDTNTKKPDEDNSAAESEQTTASATLSRDQFRREFGKIYAEYAIKYGRENVVQRIIPSPQETTVSQVSQTIEPGVEWIPPLEQPKATDLKGKNPKVTVTFIVDPKGKIVKKSMFSSENSNIDAIVKKTLPAYESKFMPLEGKIRIVTINYEFPG
jgi:hypothetical protein